MRLLLVEDEAPLRLTLALKLQAEGWQVDQATDGATGLHLAREYPVDILVLDLGLPKLSGIELLKALRAEGRKLPVLILTARGSWQEKVAGLEAGADDYLVKPFEFPELAARLKALVRRVGQAASDQLAFGPLVLDTGAQAVRLDGQPLELTAFEWRLLDYLVRQRPRVVPKQELSDYLYPHGEDRDSNVLEVLVGRLRRKIDPQGVLAPIETVRGRGYRFTLDGA